MSSPLLQAFYKSLKWEKFIETLRIERANADGVVICEHCGQPIIKKYDCIGHHIEELTDDNVNDVMISLNPNNIKLIHFKCHNEIHKRFGYAERQEQKVYIVMLKCTTRFHRFSVGKTAKITGASETRTSCGLWI